MIRPLLVFLMVLVAWPSLAMAKPTRVVIGPIEGDDEGDVTTAVKAAIGSDVVIVGKRELTKAAEKLKLSEELTEKEIKKLVKELDADAVLKGSLDKGDAMALHIKLYLRAGGKPKAFTLSFSSATSDKFRAALRKTVLSKLGVVEAPDAAGGGDDGDDATPVKPTKPPKKPKKPEKPVDDAGDDGDDAAPVKPTKPPKKPKKPTIADGGDDAAPADDGDEAPVKKPKKPKKPKKKPADDDSDAASEGNDGDDEVAPAPLPAHLANRDAVRVEFGLSATARSLSFASRNFPQAPKPYSNGAVPGARVEGEIYPFGFSDPKSPAAGLGLSFDYDKTLSLTLRSTDANGNVVAAKANEARYSIGARYRILFGQKLTSPSLTLAVGYGARQFVVDRTALSDPNVIDIPDIAYTAVQPGVAVRLPVAPAFAFVVDARALLVLDAGAVQRLDQYGQAKVTGGQVMAGVDIVIANRYAIRVVGEFAQFGFAFVGNGAMTVNRDGDASSKDIGGAADRYFGGAATFGVLY